MTTQPGKTPEELSPRPLMRILGDFANSQILDAALEYDFFTLIIHKGFRTADEKFAHCNQTFPRATTFVRRADCFGAYRKKDRRYSLPTCERSFFSSGKPSSWGLPSCGLALWDGLAL